MARMTEKIKELFKKRPVVSLATASKGGIPNVVAIGAKKILDDETILVSDQYFDKTLSNLRENPTAAIAFWDKNEGYQLKGTVTVETSGPRYEETVRWIDDVARQLELPLKSKRAVIITITEIYSITPGGSAGRRIA